MAAYEYWTHGVAVVPEEISGTGDPTVTRKGTGTEISWTAGAVLRLMLHIPTPRALAGAGWSVWCSHGYVRLAGSNVTLVEFDVQDGERRAVAVTPAVPWAVPTAATTWSPDLLMTAFVPKGALVVCVNVRFAAATSRLVVVGAGLRFEEKST